MTQGSRMRIVALLCAAFAAFSAPSAFAQGTTQDVYDETSIIGDIEGNTPSSGTAGETAPKAKAAAPAPAKEESGSLPFTGLDLTIVALMGLALLGTGLLIRRSTRSKTAS